MQLSPITSYLPIPPTHIFLINRILSLFLATGKEKDNEEQARSLFWTGKERTRAEREDLHCREGAAAEKKLQQPL